MLRRYLLALPLLFLASESMAQPKRWTVASQPSIRLGHDEADTLATFALVESAIRLADGSIIVGDRATDYALKRFAPDGKLLQRYARKGTGPGEIDYLARLSRCGDSLYAYDVEGRRQQVYTLDGRYVRVFSFSGAAGNSPYRSACNARGLFVHFGWETVSQVKGGIFRARVPAWSSGADAGILSVFDSILGSERWGLVVDDQLRGTRPRPLGKEPVIGIGRDRVYVGTADRFEVSVLDLTGRRVATLRRNEPPLPVTKEDVREFIEREIAEEGEPNRARIERNYSRIEFPKSLPAYTSLLVDSDDFAWIRHFPRGTSTTAKWTVFTAAGGIVAEVEVPRHLEVFEIGRDYLLGRWFDPDEAIPEVRLYALRR